MKRWPHLALLVFVPLLLFLGYWQLERADEKRALQAEYDRRAGEAPIEIGARLQPAEELQFYRVEARGHYESTYQILLDNRVHHGMVGYQVITPLRIGSSDTRLLVNRGWIPIGTDRQHLPAIEVPSGPVTIRGTATIPHEGFVLGELSPLARDRPTVWQQLDLARYARTVPFSVQPIVVLLDPDAPSGFARDWARLDAGIAVHQGYAFQWFMLAATLVVIYFVLRYRERRGRGQAS